MDVIVRGNHVEIPDRVRATATTKVQGLERYVRDLRRVDVDFTAGQTKAATDSVTCEILAHYTRHLVKGRATAAEPLAALDLAVEKVERQLSRVHDKRAKAQRRGRAVLVTAPAADTAPLAPPSDDGDTSDAVIVKTKQFIVEPMDPESAALQMELLDHDFFLFTNAENGRAAVIYRRNDGHLGLIEAAG